MNYLTDIELITINQTVSEAMHGTFVIEPLSPGYGITLGNAFRRVLLSSLPGAAITTVKIQGATHEFTTIDGVKEDLVELILNLKGVRFRMHQAEPATLALTVTGPKVVTAGDFAKISNFDLVNPDHYIATVEKKKKMMIEVVVEQGLGYVPSEKRKEQKLPIGTIAIDSVFSPVSYVNVTTEHTRVGQATDYDKLTLDITTDGSIDPKEAFDKANQILMSHLHKIGTLVETVPSNQKVKKSRKRVA
jgi:DNA-directed RNA polymerase subunit alpha